MVLILSGTLRRPSPICLFLCVILRIQEQYKRGPQSHINTFQKSKASIYFLVSIGGPHMGVIKSLRIKQTGQCVRLLGGYTQLRCLNCQAHVASKQYGDCVMRRRGPQYCLAFRSSQRRQTPQTLMPHTHKSHCLSLWHKAERRVSKDNSIGQGCLQMGYHKSLGLSS